MKSYKLLTLRFASLYFILWYVFLALPNEPFQDPYSTVLMDKNGKLLGARIASDGQWRFKSGKPVPLKMELCIINFEDKHFRTHVGISLTGISRAILQNSRKGKVVSGGSTITQQVVRLMRKNPPRTYTEKLYEMLLATRLEWHHSKNEILKMYCDNAPFGTNVVGLEAAAWRYFGRTPEELSWAESATLAVLPNAPGLIYPGKNHETLLQKRNRLLQVLFDQKYLDESEFYLALEEPIPGRPEPLPSSTSHLFEYALQQNGYGKITKSTIDGKYQDEIEKQVELYIGQLSEQGIHNAAVIVSDNNTGKVISYVGNVSSALDPDANYVDCNRARRSTGSILKPFLYLKALEKGVITPKELLPDYPSKFGSFSPDNFNKTYSGLVPANRALSKSLNIPFVHLLKTYGLARFHHDLQEIGFSHMRRTSDYYGLSLILGGAEASPIEVHTAFLNMARTLNNQANVKFNYTNENLTRQITWDKSAIYATLSALVEVNRPDEENNWRAFESAQKIAWKTGTSFGFRDAWAVGVTKRYTVSVWVGNADGEGKPGLTGVRAAAPLLFTIFKALPKAKNWFKEPANLKAVSICSESGLIAEKNCTHQSWSKIPSSCMDNKTCTYHQLLHLDSTGTFQVDVANYPYDKIHRKSWFVIPIAAQKYYQLAHPDYLPQPDLHLKNERTSTSNFLRITYPVNNTHIFVPKLISGENGKIILEAAHHSKSAIIYWHLDKTYLGKTTEIHQLSVAPPKGKHTLLIVDETGKSHQIKFYVK